MSKNNQDTDRAPIAFSEEYRRAKRNVLFWATATTLISVGSASHADHIKLTGLFQGISFAPNIVILGSVAALVFMGLSYIRADVRLVSQNSKFMLDLESQSLDQNTETPDMAAARRLGITADYAEKIEEEMAKVSTKTKEIGEEIIGIGDAISKKIRDKIILHEADWSHDVNIMKNTRSRIEHLLKKYDQQEQPELKNQILADISSIESLTAPARHEKWAASTNDFISFSSIYEPARAQLELLQKETSALSKNLRGLSRNIGRVEKWSFFVLDRGVVGAMFCIAIGLAVWNLGSPESLAKLQSGVFGTAASEIDTPANSTTTE